MKFAPHHLVFLIGLTGSAFAVDVDVDIGLGHPRPARVVEVQPAPVVERVWIPPTVVQRNEHVIIAPAHIERRSEQVCVAPARRDWRFEQVQVSPWHVEVIKENVIVRPAGVERRWIPAEVTGETKIGPIKIKGTVEDGHWEEVRVPAEYRVVERRVEIPAKYEVVKREYDAPARYETVVKEVEIPAQYGDAVREVTIPGHYEERTVVPPPQTVVVEPKHHSGIDVDIDIFKKH